MHSEKTKNNLNSGEPAPTGSRIPFVFALRLVLCEFLVAHRTGMMLPRGGLRHRWIRLGCCRRRVGRHQLGGRLAGLVRPQVPAFALCRPVHAIVPVTALRRRSFRRNKTIIRARIRRHFDARNRCEQRSNNRGHPDRIRKSSHPRLTSITLSAQCLQRTRLQDRQSPAKRTFDCDQIAMREPSKRSTENH